MKATGLILLFILSSCSSDKITDLKGKKFVLVESDTMYMFDHTAYLYHIANLSNILAPYENIMRSHYRKQESQQEEILINRIETLKTQLVPPEYRAKRALNFLGSVLKFVTGTPDHDDLIEIKTGLNQLIENNNEQRKINSQFEKILETLDPKYITEKLIMTEVLKEFESITNTINFARLGNFYSGTLNLKEINEVISNEIYNIPVINILEYSDIHVCMFKTAIITIYKYPVISNKCQLYQVIPLAFKHGKYELNQKVSKCNNEFINVSKCKNYLGISICKQELKDNCTIPLLSNQQAQCNIIQENNIPIQILDHGNIVITNEHTWNGLKINGPHLIQFKTSTSIDNKTYVNHQEEIKNVIHAHNNEQVDVLKILASNSNYKFNNIQQLYKYVIPLEEHPLKFTLYVIFFIITFILTIYLYIKLSKYHRNQREEQRRLIFERAYEAELLRLQQI